MINKTIDDILAVMCDDSTFSKATTKEEWQQENETQPFAMMAYDEGAPDYSSLPGQFFPPEDFMTTHRFFIKLDGRIYGFDLPGPGDPYSPWSYGINLDRGGRKPVVESIRHKKCYPMMVEDWLTYYHKVGFDYGEEVNGIKPMVLKSSKSVRGVEADLKRMQDYHEQWRIEYEARRQDKWDDYREWSDQMEAEFKVLVADMAEKAKRRT